MTPRQIVPHCNNIPVQPKTPRSLKRKQKRSVVVFYLLEIRLPIYFVCPNFSSFGSNDIRWDSSIYSTSDIHLHWYLKCTWKYKTDLKSFVKVLKSSIFANNLEKKKSFFPVVPIPKTILVLSEKLKFYEASKAWDPYSRQGHAILAH